MTPTRLRQCLDALHWSQRGLASVLAYDEATVRKWARGAAPVPVKVAEWLDALARVHEARPLPEGWARAAA